MKTLIDYGDGVSLDLDLADNERSWADAALAHKEKHACRDCGHPKGRHGRSGCEVVQETFSNGWKQRKCGCSGAGSKAA